MRRVLAGLRWYLREVTGESRWDAYRAECARHGHPPLSRREFERARADARAGSVGSRCC